MSAWNINRWLITGLAQRLTGTVRPTLQTHASVGRARRPAQLGLSRRDFLALLGVAGVAVLLLGNSAGCTSGAAASPVPSVPLRTPPPRAWEDSEILRTGRWAG